MPASICPGGAAVANPGIRRGTDYGDGEPIRLKDQLCHPANILDSDGVDLGGQVLEGGPRRPFAEQPAQQKVGQ